MVAGSLVSNVAVPTTPSYCTVAEVYETLQKPPPTDANDEGEPTDSSVKQIILDKEDEIDATCGTSWRVRKVTLEWSDWSAFIDEESWMLIRLRHTPVLTLDASQGDALDIRQGGNYEDWLATKIQGPNGHFWLQEPDGFLRLRRGLFQLTDQARVRVAYRYGESAVPQAVRSACRQLVAAEIVSGDLVSIGGRGGEVDRLGIDPRVRRWERNAYSILARFQHWGGS